jgi:hypothetical protein
VTQVDGAQPRSMIDRAVADCFDALLDALRRCADDHRAWAAEALGKRNDAVAKRCLHAVEHIMETIDKVEAVYRNCKDGWPSPPPPPPPTPCPRRRRSTLRVHLNHKVIEFPTAAETFARAIEEIGVERVAHLNKVLCGIPLISTSEVGSYQEQFRIGKFKICTHSNTKEKKRLLEKIAVELGVPLRVEIVT